MPQVPVINSAGRTVQHLDADFAKTLKGVRLVVVRKTGRVLKVLLPEHSAWTEDLLRRRKGSNWGRSFEQPLEAGVVHALKGVMGSER